MPWAGLALGTLGAGFAHQFGAAWTFTDCRIGSPWMVAFGVIVGLALTGGGALESWKAFSPAQDPTRRTIAAISMAVAALFALAILLPVIAALIIPRCWA